MIERERHKSSEIKSIKYDDKVDLYTIMPIEKARMYKKAAENVVKKEKLKGSNKNDELQLPAIKYITQARAGGIFRYPRGETYQVNLHEVGIHIIARDEKVYKLFWKEINLLSSKNKK